MSATSPYLSLPLRSEVDVALGKLMAAIEDGRTEVLNAARHGELGVARESVKQFQNICTLYDRYCAARLIHGGNPPAIEDVREAAYDR